MRPLVCIFAHPDDEAFGPGGTIAKFAQTRDVYIICATKGEVGKYQGGQGRHNMAEIRASELRHSAKILGVKHVFFLGFRDGTLANGIYHDIAHKIEKILEKLKPDTILTYEPRGISGHLDHIAISMVSSYVFERLRFIKKLMQYCRLARPGDKKHKYFVYRPPGYTESEIDLVVDTKSVWPIKLEAMLQHQSQLHDIKRIMKWNKNVPKKEYFLVQRKKI